MAIHSIDAQRSRSRRRIGPVGTVTRLAGAGAMLFVAVGVGDGVQW